MSELTTSHFFRCCMENDSERLLQHLAEEGADPNTLDDIHRTPLHYAAIGNSVDCLKILLQAGACTEMRDIHGATPIFFTVQYDAAAESLKVLLDGGANSNIKNKEGWTPLHLALLRRTTKCFDILMQHPHIDLNACNADGSTPLHIAAHRTSKRHMKKLLDAGANPFAKNTTGNTFLDLLLKKQDREEMKEYVELVSISSIKEPDCL
jgi:ankyrin repeat protein